MQRRDFLRYGSIFGTGALCTPTLLLGDDARSFSDFKAIVTVGMRGGNDALNTFIPAGSDSKAGYDNYKKVRSAIAAIPSNDSMDKLKKLVDTSGALAIGNASDNPYYDNNKNIAASYKKGFYLHDDSRFKGKIATNIMMPEVAYWLDRGRGAVVQNMGNISAPYTKSELKADPGKLPPFVFAHDQQSRLAHLGTADSISRPNGWLGLIADQWGSVNPETIYKMNVNLSPYGTDRALFGALTVPMNFSQNGPVDMQKFIDKEFETWANNRTYSDMFENFYTKLRKSSFLEMRQTLEDWNNILTDGNPFQGLTDAYGNAIYDGAGRDPEVTLEQLGLASGGNTNFVESFKTAARLIAIAKNKGLHRIAISITLGGFDQHTSLPTYHASRLRGVSLGIDAFMRAMEKLGILDKVALVSLSEFSRSTANNGSGSDHAWGGAQFVLGAVNAGNYGTFPDLTPGSDQDLTNKGRLIPTTSYSQYYATILKWFGATESEIDHALPELKNFSIRDLGFMKKG